MSNKSVRIEGGFFVPLLTLIFITMKLTAVIDWSWWWVLAPIWGPFALITLIFIGGMSVAAIANYFSDRKNKKKRV